MRNTYFVKCPYCGANLDPGERCNCQEEKDEGKKIKEQNLKVVGFRGLLYPTGKIKKK